MVCIDERIGVADSSRRHPSRITEPVKIVARSHSCGELQAHGVAGRRRGRGPWEQEDAGSCELCHLLEDCLQTPLASITESRKVWRQCS